MATATKKRWGKAAKEEAEAQALKNMPEADGNGMGDKAPECNIAASYMEMKCSSCEYEWSVAAGYDGDQRGTCPKCGSHSVVPPLDPEPKAGPSETIMRDKIAAKSDSPEPDDATRKAKAFDEVAELNDIAEKAFTTWSLADKRAKDLKKAYEGAVSELRGLISSTAHPAPMPLFDGKSAAAGDSDDDETTAEVNPTDDSWKNVPLRDALPELSATIHGKLEGAQLFTMGELANWTAESGGRRRLTDIAGIGGAASGKIEEATMAFWARQKPPVVNEREPHFGQVGAFYRMVPIDWDLIAGEDKPINSSNLKTIGDLEDDAARVGLSVFDCLKGLGMGGVAADDVVQWLKEVKEDMS